MKTIVVLSGLLLAAAGAQAQASGPQDQTVTWRTYGAERSARVRVFPAPDERRPWTVVVDDRASNGAPVTDEVTYVAETVGRTFGFDPVGATFVFRFTPAAFHADGRDGGKTLLLRATFRRGTSGALLSPDWRVITAEALDDLTDRAYR